VESITRLSSVDLVSDPASVIGLREQAETSEDEAGDLSPEEHYQQACEKACMSIIQSIIDGDVDLAAGLKEIKGHIQDHQKRFKKSEGQPGGEPEEAAVEESAKPYQDAILLIESLGAPITSALIKSVVASADDPSRRAVITAAKRAALVKHPRSGKPEVKIEESAPTEAERDAEFFRSVRSRWQ
jgi:hypothetical protein